MEDAIQQFRITTWPGPIRPPSREGTIGGGHYHLIDDGVIAADIGLFGVMQWIDERSGIEGDVLNRVAGRRDASVVSAPGLRRPDEVMAVGEVYLELVTVDLDDPEAILSFVRRFGPLGVAHEWFVVFRSLPWFASVLKELAQSWPYDSEATYKSERGRSLWAREVETLAEFRFGARCIRDCIRAWEIVRSGTSVPAGDWESVPTRELRRLRKHYSDMGLGEGQGFEAVEFLLKKVLGGGLIPFHPAVLDASDREPHPGSTASDMPLYSHCCLELFNHIAESASYRVCANSKCGRKFVRQTGRAEQGQFRSRGVKYCSVHCARAQAQRMHRGRKQASAS